PPRSTRFPYTTLFRSSFYLLSLPFLHSIVNWALGLGFMGTLLVAVLYAWRGDSFDLNFSPLAIAHLSATLAVFAVALAGWLWLGDRKSTRLNSSHVEI